MKLEAQGAEIKSEWFFPLPFLPVCPEGKCLRGSCLLPVCVLVWLSVGSRESVVEASVSWIAVDRERACCCAGLWPQALPVEVDAADIAASCQDLLPWDM